METTQVIKLLRQRQGDGSQRSLAAKLGISDVYLSDVLTGKRTPGPKILRALGLQQRIVYSKNNA